MKFFIPTVGTKFKLDEPWSFLLYAVDRNIEMLESFGPNVEHLVWEPVEDYWSGFVYGNLESVQSKFMADKPVAFGGTVRVSVAAAKFFLPAGTVLEVVRIDMGGKGASRLDAISLKIRETTHPFLLLNGKTPGGRRKKSLGDFWVLPCDFNQVRATIIENTELDHMGQIQGTLPTP